MFPRIVAKPMMSFMYGVNVSLFSVILIGIGICWIAWYHASAVFIIKRLSGGLPCLSVCFFLTQYLHSLREKGRSFSWLIMSDARFTSVVSCRYFLVRQCICMSKEWLNQSDSDAIKIRVNFGPRSPFHGAQML